MSRRCGSSRTLGPARQCAVYVRGGCACVWCWVVLGSAKEATIEHLDSDHTNNDPSNVVPACRWCNRVREDHWVSPEPWETSSALAADARRGGPFDRYLLTKGQSLLQACIRIESQRYVALDMADGLALAKQWHASRYAAEATRNRLWRADKKIEAQERRAIEAPPDGAEVSFP